MGCLLLRFPSSTDAMDQIYSLIASNLSVPKACLPPSRKLSLQSIVQPSTLEAFFAGIDKESLPVYKGEMGNAWATQVHRLHVFHSNW